MFNVKELSSSQNYSIKACYDILDWNVALGKSSTIKTLDLVDGDGVEADPIDVGLSVKWASWNLGASCKSDKGFKLNWGGISIEDPTQLDIMNVDITGTQYDPATVLWGPEWRLPTVTEWSELVGSYQNLRATIMAKGGIILKDQIFLPEDAITQYISGQYGYGCYFFMYEYCYSGSLRTTGSKLYVRPVYDPLPQLDVATAKNITSTSAILISNVVRIGGGEVTKRGFVYSNEENPTIETSSHIDVDEDFSVELSGLTPATTYYVKSYATNSYGTSYGEQMSFITLDDAPEVIDLSEDGTANSYIVSDSGSYKFTPTKGNSTESVGSIASVEVLWESFGTDMTPNTGDLVKNVKNINGVISFDTPETFKEGNAIIAAKDASDNILWSWHIWLTDQPEEQIYYNNAGTMMDRNLGATSATPGDVGALGLYYQWGRKDPFLGSSSISQAILQRHRQEHGQILLRQANLQELLPIRFVLQCHL